MARDLKVTHIACKLHYSVGNGKKWSISGGDSVCGFLVPVVAKKTIASQKKSRACGARRPDTVIGNENMRDG